jgi:lysozyme
MTPLIKAAVERILPLLKEFEGFRANTYYCLGKKLTIGWGRTINVKKGDTTTPHEEEPWLVEYLEDLAVQILAIHPHLTVNQLAALLSFIYNIGIGQYSSSTMRKLLNKGQVVDAAGEFPKWNKVLGKVSDWQIKRRAKEREVFLSA